MNRAEREGVKLKRLDIADGIARRRGARYAGWAMPLIIAERVGDEVGARQGVQHQRVCWGRRDHVRDWHTWGNPRLIGRDSAS